MCKNFRKIIGILLCLFNLLILLPVSIRADETNVIKVGSFEETYNAINQKGERSGYGYEYLQNIAGYAGWTYEYVDSNWSDCFKQLENGEIDLLGGISYTVERAETMLFSELPMGEEKYYIYTDANHSNLSAADLKSFDGKNIGVLIDHIPETVLNKWEERYGIKTHHVNISSTQEILEKLASHEIDCFVSLEEGRWDELNILPITNIGESSVYFVISKKRPDIKEALDSVMRRIKDDNPFYTDELYQRYFQTRTRAFLSEDEKQWLENHGDIRIGFLNNDAGVSVVNPNTKEISGVITDYIMLAQNCLQNEIIDFELRGYDTRQEQLEALKNGEIDLIFHFSQNPYVAETNGFVLSDTVWTFNMAAISLKNGFDESGNNLAAICKDNIALKAYVSYNYPNWDIVEYDDLNATIKAVLDGEADCFLANSGVASNYLKNNKFQSVFLTKPANASFAIKQNESLLLSIMNKTLMYMPTSKLSGAVVSYSNALHKVSAKEFIQDNALILSTVLICAFLIIMFIILRLLHKSNKSALLALQANKRLEENQKELQKALVEAQSAVKAKTTFLNNMSHDIRTPINGIIGMLNILEKSENDPKQVHECISKISMSSHLLLSLINDVLDMAKLDSGASIIDNESIDINKVCDEITTTLLFQAQEAGIEVNIEHDDYEGLYVFGNSLYLKKVLMNLFTNSVKYNKPKGSINLSMKTLKRTKEDISIEFKIQDTGIGMSKDFVENKLFVPFVQAENSSRTKYMGTGLGMPIVKSIVEKMNGTIDVTSTLGEGTCFRVVLPFKIDNLPKTDNDETVGDIKGLNILLVEDNDLNVEIAKYMLTDSGAKVTVAYNGQEALQIFKVSSPYTYDAILMDVMMPIMDGLAATRKIRELNRDDAKDVPIIAMTANVFKEDKDKCIEAGMNDHLGKPLEIEKVKKSIVEQIEMHRARKEDHEKN